MICFKIVLELVGNGLDYVWQFVENLSNTRAGIHEKSYSQSQTQT